MLIEPKIDGCAIAIKYKYGKFDSAISRKGKDVSKKIAQVQDVPKEINIRSIFVVRGELFAQQEAPSCSQRIAAGYLRSKDYKPIQKLASVRSKSLTPRQTNTKVSITLGSWALPYLKLLKQIGLAK